MDAFESLDEIIEEVRNAKQVPLSASCIVNRQDFMDKLEGLKAALPEELKQARWMMRDREEVVGKTTGEVEKMIAEAKEQRDHMVSRTEIVATASRESDKILGEAEARAREIRMEAEDYIDAKLANFELILQRTLGAVTKGRESLHGRMEDLASEVDSDVVAD